MANVVKAEVEAACRQLRENGFCGVLAEALGNELIMVGNGSNIVINVNSNNVVGSNNVVDSNIITNSTLANNDNIIKLLFSVIEAQSRQITQLAELLSQRNNSSTKA